MHQNASKNENAGHQNSSFWDYLQVLLKHRWMIMRNCLVILVLAIMISLLLPAKYTATATLLPPEQTNTFNPLTGMSGDLISNFNFLNVNTTAELFVQILQSRSVQQAVLERRYALKNDTTTLIQYFKAQTIESALRKLNSVTTIQATREGIVSIAIELGSPELAAAVANTYVAELDSVNQEKSTSQAKNSRIYIENQLELTKQRLSRADNSLAEFMQTNKAIALEEQTRAAIEETGTLKGRIIAKEVELAMKQRVRKPNHEEVLAIQAELTELKKQYAKLQYGSTPPSPEEKNEFYIPMAQVPDVALRLAELLREVKVQETVFELLNQQYYQAKIQEAKDTPTVQVLDEAIPPTTRSKPQRALIVLLAVGSIFCLSIFWAFFTEYFTTIATKENNREKIYFVKSTLKQDLQNIKQRFMKAWQVFQRKK